MGFSGFLNVVILILMLSSFVKTSMADPRADIAAFVCNSSTALSYSRNFILVMTNLSSQVNQNGFGKISVGEGPNGVFGLAQCYNDLNSSDCSLCFSKIRSVLPTCYRVGIGGRLFLDGCFGRYENYSFFDQGIDSIVVKNCSSSKNNSQADKFGELLRKVVENVSLRAAQISSNGFAVGSESVSNLSVYALAQCWDSLDVKTCNSCLQASASELISCSPAVEGRSLNAGCYMRYSNKIIWNSDQSTESSPGNHHKSLWIILGSVLGGCLLILMGIFIWKGKGCLGRSRDEYGSRLSVAISHSRLNFRYQELRSATNGFDISNKLGQGSYGTIYKGILPDGKEVAVKRLFLNTRQWADQFLNEVNLINQVRHKNLVKLLGCSVDGPESLLVFEYYYNKSLDHFIFDKDQAKVLDWQKRFDIVQGVAEGLAYLHQESEIRIIHRDIKASNILLNDKFRPKITDFGLARSFMEDQTHLSTGIAGTIGYMAPEYAIHGHLTDKADVYSFGVLVLEIVTGQRCSKSVGAKLGQHFLAKIWSHYKAKTFNKIIDRSFYEEALEDEILHVVHVGLMCTQATPYYRPTMAKVVELLRSNRDHQGDVFPTDPPFLDFLASTTNTSHEEGEESSHVRVSVASDPSFSGSSGSLLSGR